MKKNPKPNPRQNSLGFGKVLLLSSLLLTSLSCAEATKVKVRPGEGSVSFSLPSNPTTGYSWSVVSYDHNLLSFKKSQYRTGRSLRIGQGGTQVFLFTILKPQKKLDTVITLNYTRPWEGKAVQTKTIHIISSKYNFFNF